MTKVPFSIDPAMRGVDPNVQASNASGVPFRRSCALQFEERLSDFDRQSYQSLRLNPSLEGLDRLLGLNVMRLERPSYAVFDGGKSLLATHVLRHSPSGLKWRNGWGAISCLEPGAILLNQGHKDSLIEISPAKRDLPCDCVRVCLRADSETELSLRFEAHDFPFCNSSEACVRLILGSYRAHVAEAAPLRRLGILDIDVAPMSELEIPVAASELGLAILTSGSLQSGGETVEGLHAFAFNGREPLARLTTLSGASVLWLAIPRSTPFRTQGSVVDMHG